MNREVFQETVQYRIIDRCPSEVSNSTLDRLCRYPEILADFTIVSARNNGLIYGNKHCAKCYNVTDVVEWPLQVSIPECLDMLSHQDFLTFAERDSALSRNCILTSNPPNPQTVLASTCLSAMKLYTDTCNTSKKWEELDSTVYDGCEKSGTAGLSVFTDLIYSNIYCYICNQSPHLISSGLCKFEDILETIFKAQQSLLVMINMYEFTEEEAECMTYEVLDPYTVSLLILSVDRRPGSEIS